MSPENTQKLLAAAPQLYRGRTLPVTQNLMAFGFECGDGWFGLLLEASEAIEEHITLKYGHLPPEERPLATQVKEKYGTLRFYAGGDHTIHALTSHAEQQSECICEQCGEWGERRGTGWVYTACDEHTRPEDKIEDTK